MTRNFLLCLCLLLLAGCARQSTVTGEVAYEGKPIEQGVITFLPADGKGSAASADIEAGRFTVEEVMPGPKVVQITATRTVPFARSSEEMAQRHAAAKAKGNHTGIIDPADVIAADAEGNNQTVEVKAGVQTMNFALKKGKKR